MTYPLVRMAHKIMASNLVVKLGLLIVAATACAVLAVLLTLISGQSDPIWLADKLHKIPVTLSIGFGLSTIGLLASK